MAMKEINAKKIKRGVLFTVLGISIVVIASLMIYANFTYSEGTRNGTIIKISKKGNLFKTHEGQLNVGAYINNESGKIPTTIWEFSVPKDNTDVLDEINKSVDLGKRVKLYYKEKLTTLPWRGDTKYMIYKVDIL